MKKENEKKLKEPKKEKEVKTSSRAKEQKNVTSEKRGDRSKYKKERIISLIVILAIILLVSYFVISGKLSGDKTVSNNTDEQSTTNQNKSITEEKKVGDFVISNSEISASSDFSSLIAKIKNNGKAVEDLQLSVKFYDKDKNVVYEGIMSAGNLDEGMESEISIGLSMDLSNITDVEYGIME